MSWESARAAKPFLPGATIGVLGNGQLGRMMAIAARQMGYRVSVFGQQADSPAGQVADKEFVAPFDDLDALRAFAESADIITLETENIPLAVVETTSAVTPTCPGTEALRVCQNRGLEKAFLTAGNIPTCANAIVSSESELTDFCRQHLPAVLKTTTGGYDGKGQVMLRELSEVGEAWSALGDAEKIAEAFVEFDFEFSIVGARSQSGEFAAYPTVRNAHRDHILDVTTTPSGLSPEHEAEAVAIVRQIMESLDCVGVLAVEFFHAGDQILVNEIAPRPHNSGHVTIDAHATSQFEQHIRAICDLPLGPTYAFGPAASANLLGCEWSEGEPAWNRALSVAGCKLHLYGKQKPQAKRKMGHITSLGDSVDDAEARVRRARALLRASQADTESPSETAAHIPAR